MVQADAALIHRLVGNLFDNELKHLPSGCTVTIQLESDHELASLKIEDDGPGFAPEVIDHLFESRVKGKESSGHGLGLAFVDAVTRAHGGAVSASNREEGGAKITVILPLAACGHIESPSKAAHGSLPIPSGEMQNFVVVSKDPLRSAVAKKGDTAQDIKPNGPAPFSVVMNDADSRSPLALSLRG
jgi:hypothetical protein